jgi:hypothetical protein
LEKNRKEKRVVGTNYNAKIMGILYRRQKISRNREESLKICQE